MASSIEFVEFVASQLETLGVVRYRKMFGEYMVYVNEKPILLVCDDIAYVKMHPDISEMMDDAEIGVPYPGAKVHYILDAGHKDVLLKVVSTLERVLPFPKKKARKTERL
ncbi:MAG: TfoX/Sxy family protein [Bacteroidales bacterium]|nr:TfoX/Sxy family protein [Bacteroidales bacterium]